MPVDPTIGRHLRMAEESMSECRCLARMGSGNAVMWCNRATQGVAKAALQAEAVYYGRESSITALAAMLPPGHPMGTALAGLSDLDAYGEGFRLPGSDGRIPDPPPEDALADMMTRAEAALEAASRLLGVNLDAETAVPLVSV